MKNSLIDGRGGKIFQEWRVKKILGLGRVPIFQGCIFVWVGGGGFNTPLHAKVNMNISKVNNND